ncbi:MAG: BrnA antitoxin family protein [Sheuella sp.]|nr:BrnA antitoxin family protein [Sheuella sp.]
MLNKVKTKSGRVLIVPSSEENTVITKAAMSDRDAKPLTDAQWEAIKPKLRRGRPPVANKKVLVSVRFDPDVVLGMKSTGRGWQTRVNQVMREWVTTNASIKTIASKPLTQPKLNQSKVKKLSKSSKHEYV